MRLLNIVLALTSLWTLSDAFGSTRSSDKNKVQLSNVKTLTLRNNALTSARRVSAIPQVKCIGGNAKSLYDVDVIRCKNSGSDYSSEDIQWTCQASLPPEFKLGSTDVICEGYDSPDDPYILKGSCGVEYRLVLTPMGEEKYGQRSEGFFGGESRKTSIADMINWFFTLCKPIVLTSLNVKITNGDQSLWESSYTAHTKLSQVAIDAALAHGTIGEAEVEETTMVSNLKLDMLATADVVYQAMIRRHHTHPELRASRRKARLDSDQDKKAGDQASGQARLQALLLVTWLATEAIARKRAGNPGPTTPLDLRDQVAEDLRALVLHHRAHDTKAQDLEARQGGD